MSQHTPGPCTACLPHTEVITTEYGLSYGKTNGVDLCQLHAAAPDLLAACKAVLDSALTATDHCAICGGDASKKQHGNGCVIPGVQAAIAKAEGESRKRGAEE